MNIPPAPLMATAVVIPEPLAANERYGLRASSKRDINDTIEQSRGPAGDSSGANTCRWTPALLSNVQARITGQAPGGPVDGTSSDFLTTHKWSNGLISTIMHNCRAIPMRFIIVDDSGSMNTSDGRRIIVPTNKSAKTLPKVISCTRWSELTSTLISHAEFSQESQIPTEVLLLNGAPPVIFGLPGQDSDGLTSLTETLSVSPNGKTPLCECVRSVINVVSALAPSLRACNKRAAVIICTDGESTDGKLSDALRPLEKLPVSVVIRLCTDESDIVTYWDDIDKELELELDVLDDLEMDLIDESRLSSEQMRAVVSYIFLGTGEVTKEVPHPDADWSAFLQFVKEHNRKEGVVFNPHLNKMTYWIDETKLSSMYGENTSATCTLM